jgi:regulator of replication initiation timing
MYNRVGARVEERYGRRMDEFMRSALEERLKSFEEELKKSIFGVSVDLSETLLKIQRHYEELVAENVRLRSAVKENTELKKALVEKEREIEELRRKLAALKEMSKRVDSLSKRVSDYEAKISEMNRIKKELMSLTGTNSVDEAIRALRTQFIPKSKFESTLREVKNVLGEIEELRQENARLRTENEKLKDALKTLLQEKLDEESAASFEDDQAS